MTLDLPVLIVLGCAISVFSLGFVQMLATRALTRELQGISSTTDLRHSEIDALGLESATPFLCKSLTTHD